MRNHKHIMNFKALKLQILRGSIAKRVLLRAFLVIVALAIFPSLQVIRDAKPTKLFAANSHGCGSDSVDFNPLSFPGRFLKPVSAYVLPTPQIPCRMMANISNDVFRGLMNGKFLKPGAKSLCVGEGTSSAVLALQELGFSNTFGMNRHPIFSLMRKSYVYQLEFDDGSFDFVYSSDIARASIPVLLVLEVERVLRAGGIGAMLVYSPSSNPSSMIKSVTPISLFLKSSDVLHVRGVHPLFSLVVFKKRIDWANPFECYQLPDECPSITKNRPFIEHLEPLLEEKDVGIDGGFSYLSKFRNTSSSNKFVYIEIGAGQFMNPNTTNWFLNFYPLPTRAVDVYVVDHNTTVLSSYVNRPGITFVYHPGLAGNEVAANVNPAEENEGFDFLVWFRETLSAEDFVVLKMNAVGAELQLLHQLFESGEICLVDELFLRCPDNVDGNGTMRADYLDLIKGLRGIGMFVHQWLND